MNKTMIILSVLFMVTVAFAEETESKKPRMSPLGRYTLETLGGIGGGLLLGVPGAAIGGAMSDDGESMFSGLNEAVAGFSIGYVIGSTVGVHGIGKILGYDGNYWGALGGSTIGMISSIIIGSLNENNPKVSGTVYFSLTPILSVVGNELFSQRQ